MSAVKTSVVGVSDVEPDAGVVVPTAGSVSVGHDLAADNMVGGRLREITPDVKVADPRERDTQKSAKMPTAG